MSGQRSFILTHIEGKLHLQNLNIGSKTQQLMSTKLQYQLRKSEYIMLAYDLRNA